MAPNPSSSTPTPTTPAPAGDAVGQVLARARAVAGGSASAAEASAARQEGERRSRAAADLERQLGERYNRTRASLDAFVAAGPKQREVLAAVRALAAQLPESVRAGRNLVFAGTQGTGKDHLLAALLYAAAGAGFSCRWVDGLDFFRSFRDGIKLGHTEESLLKTYVEPDVLAISDPRPPAGENTEFGLGQLKSAIDRRYRGLKPTWLTVNAKNAAELSQALTPVIFDRLRHDAEVFGCFWDSFRAGKRPG